MSVNATSSPIRLFLCGDVMIGRGIDQILPHSVKPHLYEPYVRDARRYVALAERANGPIPRPVDYAYIWGDVLEELEQFRPDLRLINLETSITTSEREWERKGIHYRMHPRNIPCLAAAGVDGCALANNHVLDWGYPGLAETRETLAEAGIAGPGAGREIEEAAAPALFPLRKGVQVVVFSLGLPTSRIPRQWAATGCKPGLNLLAQMTEEAMETLICQIAPYRQPGNVIVVSVHWGVNWGYELPSRPLSLTFPGGAILESGRDGPYTVTNVMLLSQEPGTLLLEEATAIHQTAAYSASQFALPPLSLSITRTLSAVQLVWPAVQEDVVIYRLWRSQSNPYFGPSDPGTTQLLETSTLSSAITYSDTTALLDSTQAFYLVEGTSVSGAATRTANAGVFSFAIIPGSE